MPGTPGVGPGRIVENSDQGSSVVAQVRTMGVARNWGGLLVTALLSWSLAGCGDDDGAGGGSGDVGGTGTGPSANPATMGTGGPADSGSTAARTDSGSPFGDDDGCDGGQFPNALCETESCVCCVTCHDANGGTYCDDNGAVRTCDSALGCWEAESCDGPDSVCTPAVPTDDGMTGLAASCTETIETCEEVAQRYAALSETGNNCGSCDVIPGHCDVGLGGCWEIYSPTGIAEGSTAQALFAGLAARWVALGCDENAGVCDCAEAPVVSCVEGACVPEDR